MIFLPIFIYLMCAFWEVFEALSSDLKKTWLFCKASCWAWLYSFFLLFITMLKNQIMATCKTEFHESVIKGRWETGQMLLLGFTQNNHYYISTLNFTLSKKFLVTSSNFVTFTKLLRPGLLRNSQQSRISKIESF